VSGRRRQWIGCVGSASDLTWQAAATIRQTRDDLDAVSTEWPILVVHQSGHLGAANSAALALFGYDANTEDPAGGKILRREGSTEPNGVLEENAFTAAIFGIMGGLRPDDAPIIITSGAGLIASFGYTTAQEGKASAGIADLIAATGAAGALPIDIVSYVDIQMDRDYVPTAFSPTYKDNARVAGYKLTIDGSPQGFTALRDKPYYNPPEGYREDYVGYSSASADQVFEAIDWAFANDTQIIVHSNGEGASDLYIGALKAATKAHGAGDRRPVLIHGQFLRKDQVAAYDDLGVFMSLFPMHTFYWGDWHLDRTVGPVAGDDISPTGWVLERGMMFSSHHDAPVAFPDSMRILDATVTRRSRSGDVIGPEHRVDVMTALKAMTIWPAYQHFEEDRKGSLEPGKLADFVILSEDPTAIDPEEIDTIKVIETIKEGETIFLRDGD